MERERLTQLLGEPERVAREDLVGLRELAERYPWFSGAHLLLAVGEHASGDVLFDERLRTTAANVPSRAVVFDLVQPPDEPAPTRRATPADAGPMRLPSVATERPLDFEDHPIEPVAVALPTAIEPPGAPEQPVIEEAPQPTTATATEAPEATEDPLERQIMQAAYAQVYDLTWKEQVPPPAPIAEVPAPIPSPADQVAEAPAQASLVLSPSSRFRFSEWLDLSSEVPPPAPVAQASATSDWLRPSLGGNDRPSITTESAETPPSDMRALIDRFIQGQTPAPVRKAEFYTPQQAAKRSLEDHADLVTETLARIYEQQGNLAKAAQAYRKLAARTPDRSAEFIERAVALEGRTGKG